MSLRLYTQTFTLAKKVHPMQWPVKAITVRTF